MQFFHFLVIALAQLAILGVAAPAPAIKHEERSTTCTKPAVRKEWYVSDGVLSDIVADRTQENPHHR